jgi:DNA recombination protein RmuC
MLIGALGAAVAALALAVLLLVLWRPGDRGEAAELRTAVAGLQAALARAEEGLRAELARTRGELYEASRALREEVGATLRTLGDSNVSALSALAQRQQGELKLFSEQLGTQLAGLAHVIEQGLKGLREAVEARLSQLQQDSSTKLEMMRATVDEKLQQTLEQRLGESFRQVSESLEQVHRGLGEMQSLAGGVGDLKKVLSNVKTRGMLGEVQLEALLAQILAPAQYDRNVATKADSAERVEFAVRLPGRDGPGGDPVWLPIDAKFPLEDYTRLVEAQERADLPAAESQAAALEARIKACARDIRDKYLNAPVTTDFALLFLPTEGLYAEVIRRPGLFETLQREFRVVVAGPSTLAALLNSLQIGFRVLAIEQRAGEVWKLLGAVKTEFGRFGDTIDKVHRRIDEASSALDHVRKRSQTIARRLRDVEELPQGQAQQLLPEPGPEDPAPTD